MPSEALPRIAANLRRVVDDIARFPEYGLRTRTRLIARWLPDRTQALLDIGCAYGASTRALAPRAGRTCGVDPNPASIERARRRAGGIDFRVAPAEALPFDDATFDAVVMGDVLEHVSDQRRALDEAFRVLRDGGSFIVTVPHKGLFRYVDVDNVLFALRLARERVAGGRAEAASRPGYDGWHRHYTRRELLKLLDQSAFCGRYEVVAVERCGLVLEALFGFVHPVASRVLGPAPALALTRLSQAPLNWEYDVSCGPLAYNLAIHVRKAAAYEP